MAFLRDLCCQTRHKGAAPPPEVCGFWFQNTASLEYRLGTREPRRLWGFGLKGSKDCPSEDSSLNWVIIDESARLLEWSSGTLQDGEPMIRDKYKGKVTTWNSSVWQLADFASPLHVSDKAQEKGWSDICLKAVLNDQMNAAGNQAQEKLLERRNDVQRAG